MSWNGKLWMDFIAPLLSTRTSGGSRTRANVVVVLPIDAPVFVYSRFILQDFSGVNVAPGLLDSEMFSPTLAEGSLQVGSIDAAGHGPYPG